MRARDESLREAPAFFERVTAVREALHGTPAAAAAPPDLSIPGATP